MADTLRKGFAIPIAPEDKQEETNEGKIWYIPHHWVYHSKKHTLRVVSDCGATYQGMSLNFQLLKGPYPTNNLIGVLTRFRQKAVAFITDVEAMFHQVHVLDEESDLLRFLWRPDGEQDGRAHIQSHIVSKLCNLCVIAVCQR